MTLKRFITLSISLAALIPLYKLALACADGGDYEAESTLFPNSITAKPVYTPFYYTEGPKYYDESWYNTRPDLPDENRAEWMAYTGAGIREADIDSFVYSSSYSDLKSLYGHIEKGTPLAMQPQYNANGMTAWFKKSRDFEALGYLMYAKQCEPHAASSGT